MSLCNYQIIKELGKGSFGRVSLVKKKIDKQIYALKQVNLMNSPKNEIEAALNEIRLLASLNHPNIIGYKDSFYDNPSRTLNIVMEFADGGDLAKKIDYNKKHHCLFNENIIWEYLIQLLNGIDYLHSQQIMHRDLKCANIFVMKNGILKIGDMNVSKLSKQNYARTKTGTPYYLAPEVWEDRPYDYKCDLWSLGCIIYELCTMYPPFRGTNFKNLYNNIKSGKYEPISPDYSQDLKQIISYMLITNPNKRYSTKDLLNMKLIQDRMKNNSLKDIIPNNQNKKVALLKTIKMPRNLKDINKVLPHERQQMGENDPYETMKKTIKLMENKDQNPNNVNNINIQPLNNYNRDLANQRRNNQNNLINNNNDINNNQYNYNNSKNNNMIKPIIIKKEENNNRREYNIFNNKNISNNESEKINNINNINNSNQKQQKIPIKDIKIINKDSNYNKNNQNNQNQQMGFSTKKRKEEKEKFAEIRNEFKNNRPQSNRMVKNNKNILKQQKQIDMKQKRLPSAQPNKMRINNNNNNNNLIQNNFKNINYINNNINMNNKNNINYNNNMNMNNRNQKRPNSHYNNRLQVKVNNNIIKNNNFHYGNNEPIKNYEIKNHNYHYQGQNFNMNPYNKNNKANYGKLDYNKYKENNKIKFNNYLHNGGRNPNNHNSNNHYNHNQINVHRQRVNPAFKQKNYIHREGKYRK